MLLVISFFRFTIIEANNSIKVMVEKKSFRLQQKVSVPFMCLRGHER